MLAGALPNVQTPDREIKIPVGAKVFVPVDNVICTEASGDPKPLEECAKRDADGANGQVSATLNGQDLRIIRIEPHKFNLDVREPIGQHPIGRTDAAADGYCTVFELPPFPNGKGYHELDIKGRGIRVKYQVKQ
jgi:hypothetical protein